jgi:hypothetical protein
VLLGVADGGGDVLGFAQAEGGIAFGRAARAAEIHEQDGGAQGVDFLRLEQEAGLFGGVAVEEDRERGVRALSGVPGGKPDAAGDFDGERLGVGREGGGRACIRGAGQMDAGEQDAELGEGREGFGLFGARAAGGVAQHGARVAIGEDVQRGESGEQQKESGQAEALDAGFHHRSRRRRVRQERHQRTCSCFSRGTHKASWTKGGSPGAGARKDQPLRRV